MDFSVLSTPESILHATRRIISTLPEGPLELERLDVPFDSEVFRALYMGSSVWLYAPVLPEGSVAAPIEEAPIEVLTLIADCDYSGSHGWGNTYWCTIVRLETGTLTQDRLLLHVGVWQTDNGIALLADSTPSGQFRLSFEGVRDDRPMTGGFTDEDGRFHLLSEVEAAE